MQEEQLKAEKLRLHQLHERHTKVKELHNKRDSLKANKIEILKEFGTEKTKLAKV